MTYSEISRLKYDIEDPFFREISLKFGIVDTCEKIWHCLMSEFGYIGGKRIDRAFLDKLPANDIAIYNKVVDWIFLNKN
jgi:hypothetical protein